jgi:hypothetical protein
MEWKMENIISFYGTVSTLQQDQNFLGLRSSFNLYGRGGVGLRPDVIRALTTHNPVSVLICL